MDTPVKYDPLSTTVENFNIIIELLKQRSTDTRTPLINDRAGLTPEQFAIKYQTIAPKPDGRVDTDAWIVQHCEKDWVVVVKDDTQKTQFEDKLKEADKVVARVYTIRDIVKAFNDSDTVPDLTALTTVAVSQSSKTLWADADDDRKTILYYWFAKVGLTGNENFVLVG